jgi:hypothetical protein
VWEGGLARRRLEQVRYDALSRYVLPPTPQYPPTCNRCAIRATSLNRTSISTLECAVLSHCHVFSSFRGDAGIQVRSGRDRADATSRNVLWSNDLRRCRSPARGENRNQPPPLSPRTYLI